MWTTKVIKSSSFLLPIITPLNIALLKIQVKEICSLFPYKIADIPLLKKHYP